MKTKILQEFLNSNIKILSQEKLKQYVEYCIYKNQINKLKNKDGYAKTAYHHILPKALFPEYKNLKENTWNGTHLLYSDHYYVHWLLTEAIDDYGQLFAFCKMHNCDIKSGRIEESDIISLEEFQKKMEKRNGEISKRNKIKAVEGTLFGGHKFNRKLAAAKRRETLLKDPSIQQNSNMAHSKTKSSKEWKETIGKESIRKQKETRSSKEWKETTEVIRVRKFKESFKKSFNKEKFDEWTLKRAKYKNFIIFNEKDEIVYRHDGLLTEFCKKHNMPMQALKKSNKNNRLYSTKAGLRNAKLKGYNIYKGWYLELL